MQLTGNRVHKAKSFINQYNQDCPRCTDDLRVHSNNNRCYDNDLHQMITEMLHMLATLGTPLPLFLRVIM